MRDRQKPQDSHGCCPPQKALHKSLDCAPLCHLCVLCVSVVDEFRVKTPQSHRARRGGTEKSQPRDFLCKAPAEPFAITFAPRREWLQLVQDLIPPQRIFTCEVFVVASTRDLLTSELVVNRVRGSATGRVRFRELCGPLTRPLLEVQDPDLEPQTRCTPARCNNDVKRAIRDPRARVALLFGRCRFVTASTF